MPELRFLPAAGKYLKKLKDKGLKEKFHEAIQTILEDPFVGEAKKGTWRGYSVWIYFIIRQIMS